MYLEAAKIDDTFADLHFRLAQCHWRLADYQTANHHYIKARNLDALRFRPDVPINDTIRSIAKEHTGIHLADAQAVFKNMSPHNTPGRELFLDHVHLNFTGNYHLARTVFDRVCNALPDRVRKHRTDNPPLTEQNFAELLAYSAYDRYAVAAGMLQYAKLPPSTNHLYHAERLARWQNLTDDLKARITPEELTRTAESFRNAVQNDNSDYYLRFRYAQMLNVFKNPIAAAEQYRLVLRNVPHFSAALVNLAMIEGKNRNVETARTLLEKAVKLTPTNVTAHYNLAMAYALQKKTAQAVRSYLTVTKLQPTFGPAYTNLGLLLYNQGKLDQAEQIYRRGLAVAPDNAYLHYNLAILLKKTGRTDEANREIQATREIDPNFGKVPRSPRRITR